MNWNVVAAFSRPYARAVAGTPTNMYFDPDSVFFQLDWTVDADRHELEQLVTEIYVPLAVHYRHGASVVVSSGLRWTFSRQMSVLYVVNDAAAGRQTGEVFTVVVQSCSDSPDSSCSITGL